MVSDLVLVSMLDPWWVMVSDLVLVSLSVQELDPMLVQEWVLHTLQHLRDQSISPSPHRKSHHSGKFDLYHPWPDTISNHPVLHYKSLDYLRCIHRFRYQSVHHLS